MVCGAAVYHRRALELGKVTMKTDVILRFAQRALWIYMVETSIVFAIVIAISVHR